VIVAEGGGLWREYVGGYSDWERVRKPQPDVASDKASPRSDKSVSDKVSKPDATAASSALTPAITGAKPKKLSFKEQRELERLPQQIAALENEQAGISARLVDPDLYREEPGEVQRLNRRFAEIDDALITALQRWEDIEARARGA
jgi:ATP-binding cassette subfamily F protein uup